jgi:hypothetical protein
MYEKGGGELTDEYNIYSNVQYKLGHSLATLAKRSSYILMTQTYTRSFPQLLF